MTSTDRTLVLTGPDNLVAHIEGLQATLTKRNERIRQLEEQLAAATEGEPTQAALKKVYRQGFKAAASKMLSAVQDARRAIDAAQRPLFDVYLEADHVERPEPRVSPEETSPIEKLEPDVVPGSEEAIILEEARS